jgi:uncharacterized membrane protein
MHRAVVTFCMVLLVLFVLTLISMPQVPNPIAVHFDSTNAPDHWVSRDFYRGVILLNIVGAPLLLFWLMGWIPRFTGGKGQVPESDYWFDRVRRKQTYDFLLQHASWLGTMTAAVIYVIHVLILQANVTQPPQLSSNRLITAILFYVCGLAWWTSTFFRHFRKR